ncbi:MAG: hypothetical protein ABS81_07410 [Pseudonocardia sp. SCN 72-86]|nr:MAG: hypothetical protein ABS81_07410 [Pseudonocardia sp. SCN 72-86]
MAQPDFDRLIADVQRNRREIVRDVERCVRRAALEIKKGWQRRLNTGGTTRHLPAVARGIRYDVDTEPGVTEATIGGGPQAAGPLAHVIELGNIEYGSVRSKPHLYGLRALLDETPQFERAVGDAADNLFRETA